jgi:hypothetical protein
VRPVDGVAADRAYQRAIQPDAEVRPEPIFQLPRDPHKELPDVIGRTRAIHPREPLSEVFAVPLDGGEQDFGVFPLEVSEFEAVGYLAPKHLHLR